MPTSSVTPTLGHTYYGGDSHGDATQEVRADRFAASLLIRLAGALHSHTLEPSMKSLEQLHMYQVPRVQAAAQEARHRSATRSLRAFTKIDQAT
ncbi:hypothetical protein ACGE24_08905 [Corynebacterium kroppenstedtii]|uniref:hypothetical protein n=1 Tax=Corynebacterium sp. PCR 32 TaxID=3351342 RepID=UPI00309DDC16